MGYYTEFELELERSTDEFPTVASIYDDYKLKYATGETDIDFSGFHYAIDKNGEMRDSCKWYEHDAELSALSTLYPDVMFLLKGEGEENGDMWHLYVKNGKSVLKTAKVVIDPLWEGEL